MQKWVTELDTVLALRLNLSDFDKLPPQFRTYTIASGRVTFRVPGEFEVDLTVADEDEDSQFWFIDFRFAFAPATDTVSELVKNYLEMSCNAVLALDGFFGCYCFLHEFVLTHKINELHRQAAELARGLWADNLLVEALPRALAIQYWAARHQGDDNAPKHWLMIGVYGSVGEDAARTTASAPATSAIVVKWFRDGKEVGDVAVDLQDISVENLLMTVIGKHTYHILSALYTRLAILPMFQDPNGQQLVISPPESPPESMSLSLGIRAKTTVRLSFEPVTGSLYLSPSDPYLEAESERLNQSKTIVEDALLSLERARCHFLLEDVVRTAACAHWEQVRRPLPADIIKNNTQVRNQHVTSFFARKGWRPDWYLMFLMSPTGDSWWACQV